MSLNGSLRLYSFLWRKFSTFCGKGIRCWQSRKEEKINTNLWQCYALASVFKPVHFTSQLLGHLWLKHLHHMIIIYTLVVFQRPLYVWVSVCLCVCMTDTRQSSQKVTRPTKPINNYNNLKKHGVKNIYRTCEVCLLDSCGDLPDVVLSCVSLK